MRRVVSYYVGLFLKIFSALLILPVIVGKYYGESFIRLEGFIMAAFLSISLGMMLSFGKKRRPDAVEGMMAATVGWIAAVSIGSIPFMYTLNWGFVNAFFEAMNGFSTTGMTIIRSVEGLPRSLIFWRAFIQWIGGLGILTFFVTVIVEAGGAAKSLVFGEANKTDSGSIRPSLFNSIKSLWYVYIVFTLLELVLLKFAGLSVFDSLTYALTTMPTGGFANTVGGVAGFESLAVEVIIFFFMIAGGTNFLLLYRILQGNIRELFSNYEFRLYLKIMAGAAVVIFFDLWMSGGSVLTSLKNSLFQTVSVTSSTGFEIKAVSSFPKVSKMVFMGLMFVGGCLGSTTGGIKMYRLGIMLKIVWREIKSFTLPRNALNFVSEAGRRISDDDLFRIVSIFFLWLSVIFATGLITVMFSPLSIAESLQGVLSSMGTMGPLVISKEALIALNPGVKIMWALSMLAGRLELIPVLVLLNVEIFKRFS